MTFLITAVILWQESYNYSIKLYTFQYLIPIVYIDSIQALILCILFHLHVSSVFPKTINIYKLNNTNKFIFIIYLKYKHTARLMSPMQVQGTELFPVTTHLEWSEADLYDTFSNPFMSFIVNDLMFIVLKTIIIWKNEFNYPFSVFYLNLLVVAGT